MDADGVLTVTAREQRSAKEASIDVVPSHGLTRDEVKGIIRESIHKAREDFSARNLVELRNKAHNLVTGTRRVLAMPERRSFFRALSISILFIGLPFRSWSR